MKYLSFDLRALALMRIGVAVVLLCDLSVRLSDLEAFYSDSGVVPLELLFRHGWNDYYFSIHTVSGLWQVQLLLFLLAFFCAALLLIGYRTQLMTMISWLMLLSLHNRNGFILQGGDDLLRMVLFWAIFLPWGKRYSYDGLMRGTYWQEPVVPMNIAMAAYLLQICYIYTGSALLKGPEWNQHFNALYYVYSLDQIAYPITRFLYYHPDLLKELTRLAYYFELLVPLLFFMPFFHPLFRTAGVVLILLFHAFNAMTLLIGFFPFIGMVTALGLLPSGFMDSLEKMWRPVRIYSTWLMVMSGAALERLLPWKNSRTLSSRGRSLQTGLLIFLLLFVFDWNFSNLHFVRSKLSDRLRFIGYALRLDQSWGMFAPGVFKDDGWYVLKGFPRQGEPPFDLLRSEHPFSLDKPEPVTRMFKNDRWRKYFENYIFHDHEFLRGYFCNYTRRVWNEKHPDRRIGTLDVIYVNEFSEEHYRKSKVRHDVLWHCGEE